ncbi:MAG TPA: hypothetical protein PLJ48_07810 [Dermatophilaceae bacterium]|nr:hypothetical protein [Dermatophilaceae bacterium]
MTETVRLTGAQALVRFLANQHSERDGVQQRLVTGMFGIFGHGNVAGVGQALLQDQTAAEAGEPGEHHDELEGARIQGIDADGRVVEHASAHDGTYLNVRGG